MSNTTTNTKKNDSVKLSDKDSKLRAFVLNGNMLRVVLYVCVPLAIYQEFNQLFHILDTMMASHISAESVSTVAYLSQLLSIFGAVGTGLAMGSSIKISEAYGAGDYVLVRKRLSSLITLCAILGGAVLCIIPFVPQLLAVMGTPQTFITIGTKYFIITLLSTVVNFFNSVYIAIERARGYSRRIMFLNFGVMFLKLTLTAVFIYGLNADITMIAVATLIAQSALFLVAIWNLSRKNDVFGFSIRYISFTRGVIQPMLHISFPVIAEKIAFALGKTVINSMSKNYGTTVVGALGVSNNLNGTVTTMQNGFQDGGASIISQNVGAGNIKRAISAFRTVLVLNIIIGFVGWLLLIAFRYPLTSIFATSINGLDTEFQQTIIRVFLWDCTGSCVSLGINSAIMSLLFGFGYTKLSLLINFSRVFVFRIPVLWALQNFTNLGSQSVGIVMGVSNVCVALLAIVIAFFTLRHIRRAYPNT